MLGKVNPYAFGRRLRLALVAAFVVALAAGSTQTTPAAAQTPPDSLADEIFSAQDFALFPVGEVDIDGECTPTAGSGFTLTYTASGPASGPYPGTFTESGAVTATLPTPDGGGASGTVVTWTANFTIDSPAGDVSGTKTKTAIMNSLASCQELGAIHFLSARSDLAYEATIVTPGGEAFTDQGTAVADLLECTSLSFSVCASAAYYENFFEQFQTSSGVVPALCADDDGDGLTNNNESIFHTFLGVRDFDNDGIVDGNDDANLNALADEDEDDGQNNDCHLDNNNNNIDDEDEDDG